MATKKIEAAEQAARKKEIKNLEQVKDVPVIAVDKGQYASKIVQTGEKFFYTGYLSKAGDLPLWTEFQDPSDKISKYIIKKVLTPAELDSIPKGGPSDETEEDVEENEEERTAVNTKAPAKKRTVSKKAPAKKVAAKKAPAKKSVAQKVADAFLPPLTE